MEAPSARLHRRLRPGSLAILTILILVFYSIIFLQTIFGHQCHRGLKISAQNGDFELCFEVAAKLRPLGVELLQRGAVSGKRGQEDAFSAKEALLPRHEDLQYREDYMIAVGDVRGGVGAFIQTADWNDLRLFGQKTMNNQLNRSHE